LRKREKERGMERYRGREIGERQRWRGREREE